MAHKGTQAILLQDVDKLGRKGDVVNVAAGYMRNYLEPRKLALAASDGMGVQVQRQEEMRRRHGLILLDAFGLNNTYAPCVTQETAKKHGLRKISDLTRVPQLRVVVDQSFLTRPDGWSGLAKKYDLRFHEPPSQISPNLLYKALEGNKVDLVIGFATDWQIQALNLVVLEDDRGYFPNYHGDPDPRRNFETLPRNRHRPPAFGG